MNIDFERILGSLLAIKIDNEIASGITTNISIKEAYGATGTITNAISYSFASSSTCAIGVVVGWASEGIFPCIWVLHMKRKKKSLDQRI